MLRRKKLAPADMVFIGDTTHDFDVAADIGCRAMLIADGHQSEDRLRKTGAEVLSSLEGLLNSNVPKSL